MNALAIEALKASATAQLYSAIETDYGASELADGDTASGTKGYTFKARALPATATLPPPGRMKSFETGP